jgi:hypothetical protein
MDFRAAWLRKYADVLGFDPRIFFVITSSSNLISCRIPIFVDGNCSTAFRTASRIMVEVRVRKLTAVPACFPNCGPQEPCQKPGLVIDPSLSYGIGPVADPCGCQGTANAPFPQRNKVSRAGASQAFLPQMKSSVKDRAAELDVCAATAGQGRIKEGAQTLSGWMVGPPHPFFRIPWNRQGLYPSLIGSLRHTGAEPLPFQNLDRRSSCDFVLISKALILRGLLLLLRPRLGSNAKLWLNNLQCIGRGEIPRGKGVP